MFAFHNHGKHDSNFNQIDLKFVVWQAWVNQPSFELNEHREVQPQYDILTGVETFVYGPSIRPNEWRECARLNRRRAEGIQIAYRPTSSSEPIAFDVWLSAVAREGRRLGVPLIPLTTLGFDSDDVDLLFTTRLQRLQSGKEAIAYRDADANCVYKLFDTRPTATIGHKLYFELGEHECRVCQMEASLDETLSKICLLHEAGACPTEIVGISDNCKYLIVKQPYCEMYVDLDKDRQKTLEYIKAVAPTCSMGAQVWVFWLKGPWIVSDLHRGNIRRFHDGTPTIIDALVAPIPDAIQYRYNRIADAVKRARSWRETGALPSDDPFKGISDEEY